MKIIKVLGTGSPNCKITAKVITIAAKRAGVEIELEKVTNITEIIACSVNSTPGVIVDGKSTHCGSIPGPDQVRSWAEG